MSINKLSIKAISFLVIAAFVVTTAFPLTETNGTGVRGYSALRPVAAKLSDKGTKGMASHFGKYKDVEFTPDTVSRLLSASVEPSEKMPPVEVIRERMQTGISSMTGSELSNILQAKLKLSEAFGEDIRKSFIDFDHFDIIPIRKVPAGEIGSAAITVKAADGKRVILVEDIVFDIPLALYIALADEAIHNSVDTFTFEEQVLATIHQLLAYLSLGRFERLQLKRQIELLKKKKEMTAFDEFIEFAESTIEKMLAEDFRYFINDEFIASLISFVRRCYPEFSDEPDLESGKIKDKIKAYVRKYRAGRWVLRDLTQKARSISMSQEANITKEKIIEQLNRIIKEEWINKAELLSFVENFGLHEGAGREIIHQIIKDNPDVFDSVCIKAIAMALAGDYSDETRHLVPFLQFVDFLETGKVPGGSGLPQQESPEQKEIKEILKQESLHFAALALLDMVAQVYPEHITQDAFSWILLSLEIFLNRWDGGMWTRDDDWYYYPGNILKSLKDTNPHIFARLLVGTEIKERELRCLMETYMQIEESESIEDKYIDIAVLEAMAELALSSEQREEAEKLLRRIVRLKPVFMLRLFESVQDKIYDLFEELKDIPIENFRNLQINIQKWGLNNPFIALCVGDKRVGKGILELDELFGGESPFVCIKVTKRIFEADSGWTIDTVKELYDTPLFRSAWSFHETCIDRILSVKGEALQGLFMVLRESMLPEDLSLIPGLFSGYRLVAILDNMDDILAVDDAVLWMRLAKLRELIYRRKNLEPSIYAKLLLAKDAGEFDQLYADMVLSIGIEVELEISQPLKDALVAYAREFDAVEPSLAEKETAEDVFCFLLQLFGLRDKPITLKNIQTAFRNLAKIYHFDKGGKDELMAMVNAANRLLKRFVDERGKVTVREIRKKPLRLPGAFGQKGIYLTINTQA